MYGVFKNGINYSKRMFREAPFFSWCVVYLFFLLLEWPRIDSWLDRYHLIARIILLSIVPLFLWWYEAHKNHKAYKLRISSFRESRILPKHEIDHLKALFADSQIDLFEKVLLPSLSLFYATFSEIGQENYYKVKVEAICKIVKELRRNPTLYSNQPQCKYRDIALTAFSFYRTLFDGAIEFFCNNAVCNEQIDKTDAWVLLKRVPARLSLVLGAQHWRLYEFWEAVYGDPRRLQLNNDIIDYFIHTENSIKDIAVSPNPVSDHGFNKIVTDNIVHAYERETSSLKEDSNANPMQKIGLEEMVDTNNISHKEYPVQEKTSTDENKNADEELASKFIAWLLKKINGDDKRYCLNNSDYIFISPLLYDTSVFITETLLNKYYQITSVSPGSLKQSLISQRILDNRRYLTESSGQRILLMRLNDISVQKTASKIVSIEEAIDGVNGLQDEVTSDGNETKNSD